MASDRSQEERKYRAEHPEEFPAHSHKEDDMTECRAESADTLGEEQRVVTGTGDTPSLARRVGRGAATRTQTKTSTRAGAARPGAGSGAGAGAGAGDWRAEFECPVCLEEMGAGARIFQCGEGGHVVCGGCRQVAVTPRHVILMPRVQRLERDTCPTCRAPITGRATALERLAAALLK